MSSILDALNKLEREKLAQQAPVSEDVEYTSPEDAVAEMFGDASVQDTRPARFRTWVPVLGALVLGIAITSLTVIVTLWLVSTPTKTVAALPIAQSDSHLVHTYSVPAKIEGDKVLEDTDAGALRKMESEKPLPAAIPVKKQEREETPEKHSPPVPRPSDVPSPSAVSPRPDVSASKAVVPESPKSGVSSSERIIPEPVAAPPTPVFPEPIASTPEPVVPEPAVEPPVSLLPEPVASMPEPVVPEPAVEPPAPVLPEPIASAPEPVISEPATVPPAPVLSEPNLRAPALVPPEPAVVPAVLDTPAEEKLENHVLADAVTVAKPYQAAPRETSREEEDLVLARAAVPSLPAKELPSLSAPSVVRSEAGTVDLGSLPRLSTQEREDYGLDNLRLNVLRPADKNQLDALAIINLKKVYVGEMIPGTPARLIAVDGGSIGVEITSGGAQKRFRIPR